jgi:hypothetical protein
MIQSTTMILRASYGVLISLAHEVQLFGAHGSIKPGFDAWFPPQIIKRMSH